MSNVAENEFKNAKNDLKNSIESWQNVMRICEESIRDEKRSKTLDYLIDKREKVARMLVPWKAIFAVMEQLDRINERLGKIEAALGQPAAVNVPLDLEVSYRDPLQDAVGLASWAGSSFDYKTFSRDLFK